MIRGTVEGDFGLAADIARLKQGAFEVARESANDAYREAVYQFGEPKSGRVYKRKGRIHQASADGESPARAEGDLVEAITPYESTSRMEAGVGYDDPKQAEIDERLNKGTEGGQMAARPLWMIVDAATEQAWEERGDRLLGEL